MRNLTPCEISAVSGGADTAPATAVRKPNPLVTIPLALFNGVFTVLNIVGNLPALLTYRF
jgi:hypothetical protein